MYSYANHHTHSPYTPDGKPPHKPHSAPVNIRPPSDLSTYQSGFGKARPLKLVRRGRYTNNITSSRPFIRGYPGETAPPDPITQCANGVDGYEPTASMTDNPQRPCAVPPLFNAEKKARMRSRGASTNIANNYYTTNHQYLQNRTNTYYQNTFHYAAAGATGSATRAQSIADDCAENNNCNYYHPNNTKFSQDGGVSASLQILAKNVATITKSAATAATYKSYPSSIYKSCGTAICK